MREANNETNVRHDSYITLFIFALPACTYDDFIGMQCNVAFGHVRDGAAKSSGEKTLGEIAPATRTRNFT